MQQQSKIPLHHCQWCYKNTGRFILDCMCIVCESCFSMKKSWIDEKGRCFYCEKSTNRKFIDLKVNPQEGGIYFQNLSLSLKNAMKIQQFQSQVSRKYCKHLERKVQKLQTVIRSFIKQFPEHRSYFDNYMAQLEQKQIAYFRSKSAAHKDLEVGQDMGKMLYHNNTDKNLMKKPMNMKPVGNNSAYMEQQNYARNNAPSEKSSLSHFQYGQNQPKRYKNQYSIASKSQIQSIRGDDYFDNMSVKYPNHNQVRNSGFKTYHQTPNFQGNKGNGMAKMKNDSAIQVFQVGGNTKFSDPTKQQVNLNNINMQTALRSIKSEDGRDNFLPFYQHNHADTRNINRAKEQVFHENDRSSKNNRFPNPQFQILQRKKGPK